MLSEDSNYQPEGLSVRLFNSGAASAFTFTIWILWIHLRQHQAPQHSAAAATDNTGVIQLVVEATTVQQSFAKLCDMIQWHVGFCVV